MVTRLWVYVCIVSIPPILYAALIVGLNYVELFHGETRNSTYVTIVAKLSP